MTPTPVQANKLSVPISNGRGLERLRLPIDITGAARPDPLVCLDPSYVQSAIRALLQSLGARIMNHVPEISITLESTAGATFRFYYLAISPSGEMDTRIIVGFHFQVGDRGELSLLGDVSGEESGEIYWWEPTWSLPVVASEMAVLEAVEKVVSDMSARSLQLADCVRNGTVPDGF